jgi:hypothetical protein
MCKHGKIVDTGCSDCRQEDEYILAVTQELVDEFWEQRGRRELSYLMKRAFKMGMDYTEGELRQNLCDSCLEYEDDGTPYTTYGWNENRVEGQIPCGCISESGPYQVSEDRITELLTALQYVAPVLVGASRMRAYDAIRGARKCKD